MMESVAKNHTLTHAQCSHAFPGHSDHGRLPTVMGMS